MKISGLKEMSDKDLQEQLTEEKQKLDNMKFQHAISGLESPVQLRYMKRNVARLITEVNTRTINK